ncbi:unnamed protein product [Dovyalis caffra]|uniref:Uncharacterized protein n=1 Tax=Dovyalis caffra TaxID=77055 RepID=A0AAV1RFC1_9ROSI|nr:unnamed protein product [Dovyalis caffra]
MFGIQIKTKDTEVQRPSPRHGLSIVLNPSSSLRYNIWHPVWRSGTKSRQKGLEEEELEDAKMSIDTYDEQEVEDDWRRNVEVPHGRVALSD